MKKIIYFSFLFFLCLDLQASLTHEHLTLYLFCELDPLVTSSDEEYPLSKETATKRILEEARNILSGMIYGYTFSYIPYDKKRKINEDFSIELISKINWGDPRLKVVHSELKDNILYVTVRYWLEDFQLDRINTWMNFSVPVSEGLGEADFFKGYIEKFSSLKNSIKNAIRNYLRKRILNKPKEISGEILLAGIPETRIKSGAYLTSSKIKLNIKKIIPYKIF